MQLNLPWGVKSVFACFLTRPVNDRTSPSARTHITTCSHTTEAVVTFRAALVTTGRRIGTHLVLTPENNMK